MHISIIEPVGGHGGMDYYDYGLAYGLGANEVQVTLYTSAETKERDFTNVKTRLFFCGVWKAPILKKTWNYISGHCRAYRDTVLNGGKIAHLHLFSFRGIDVLMLLLARFYRLKTVVTIHDANSFNSKSRNFFERWSYRFIDGIVVHNTFSLEAIRQKNVILKKTAIIPHGNYLPFVKPADDRRGKRNEFRLLFFGQIKQVKGVDVLLKAMAGVVAVRKDIKLTIAGRAYQVDLDDYTRIIADNGLAPYVNTEFRYIADEEVPGFFEDADLIVLPYREIYQSGVLLLSMSYGKPLICSDLDTFISVVKNGVTGFIFRSGDHMDLASQLLHIMQNPQLLTEVADNALAMIKKDFDWTVIGKKTKQFYEELLAEDSV